jgi:rSAM/selenodomain-associated transferase 2
VKLAVVIPALDEADRIERCVASAQAHGVELVVVDGGSRDDTGSAARRAGAKVVEAPAGRAGQLNAGVEACGADAVLFLHADSRLPPGFADAVRRALSDPSVAGGSFALVFDSDRPVMRFIQWGAGLRRRLFDLPYGDQALFARRSALEAIGGVPDVPFMEDLDLVERLKGQGRLARLSEPVTTSARRYETAGVWRTWLRNAVAVVAWRLGVDRERMARWYRR